MNLRKIEEFILKRKMSRFRLDQVRQAVFESQIFDFADLSTWSKEDREALIKEINEFSFVVEKVLVSSDHQSIKALIKLNDGKYLETVLIAPKPGEWSACISSQVGCPMGCAFCATGRSGFLRNLTAEEITDQILFWRKYLKDNLILGSFRHLVFMGMGEPFLNWNEVKLAISDLIDPKLFGLGSRNISLSTCGLTQGIECLAKEFPQINLAISLHFADDKKRSQYMPVNEKYPLLKLKEALQKYFTLTKRKVFLEYVMLENINDGEEDADNLEKFIFSTNHKKLLHVNLIRYNETGNIFKSSSREQTERFKNYLLNRGVSVTIRKSLGQDIQGACGQLAGGK